jgi:AbiTii-like protein
MTLLREIQNAAADPHVDISSLLRKAMILASRLHNPEFEAWVNQELNGYEDKRALPSYRVLPIMAKANLTDGYRQLRHAQILTGFLPENLRAWGEVCYMSHPIATIVSMAKRKNISVPWPPELAVKYGAKGYTSGGDEIHCQNAWQEINPDSLLGIVDTVRTRLVTFALKLEKENPDAGEAAPNAEPIPSDRLRPIVNNTFYAPVGNVAQNSEGFAQSSTIGMQREDIARLVTELSTHLGDLNLEQNQKQKAVAQLEVIKAELAGEPDQMVVTQSVRSLRNITEGAIGSLLATASQPTIWQWIHHFFSTLR